MLCVKCVLSGKLSTLNKSSNSYFIFNFIYYVTQRDNAHDAWGIRHLLFLVEFLSCE